MLKGLVEMKLNFLFVRVTSRDHMAEMDMRHDDWGSLKLRNDPIKLGDCKLEFFLWSDKKGLRSLLVSLTH